jgi:hypothetical protein
MSSVDFTQQTGIKTCCQFNPKVLIPDETLPVGKQVKRITSAFTMLEVKIENIDKAINELRAKGIRVSDKLKIDGLGFDELKEY